MKSIVVLIALSLSAVAQEKATVTFIAAPKNGWSEFTRAMSYGTVPGAYPFYGDLFDSTEHVAHFTPGRTLSLSLTPGKHLFFVGGGRKGPDETNGLTLLLAPGERRFVLMNSSHKGIGVVQDLAYTSVEATCSDLIPIRKHTKPLDSKHVEESYRSAVSEAALPTSCPGETVTH